MYSVIIKNITGIYENWYTGLTVNQVLRNKLVGSKPTMPAIIFLICLLCCSCIRSPDKVSFSPIILNSSTTKITFKDLTNNFDGAILKFEWEYDYLF